jgi:propanol-preferring alcohol dehydrogenase
MRAMQLTACADVGRVEDALSLVELPRPVPRADEILLEVSVCGVCHTELDEIEGRTPPPRLPIVPGHEVIGRVADMGVSCRRFTLGERVGVGWIHHSSGDEKENLSDAFVATGRDVDGGYAEYMTVPEAYACPVPAGLSDEQAAPLMCAGSIGYRALKLTDLINGQTLGLTGFGGSGHLVLQLAKHLYPDSPVFVFARSPEQRAFALDLGADWAGDTADDPPELADAIIDTTPVWAPVLAALEGLKPGGRLVINAIRKQSDDADELASLRYEDHLWLEKEIKSVANITFRDIAEFLPIAAAIPVEVETERYSLEEANRALRELKFEPVRGAKVLQVRSAD